MSNLAAGAFVLMALACSIPQSSDEAPVAPTSASTSTSLPPETSLAHEEVLGNLSCADGQSCAQGFELSGVAYESTCGPLDLSTNQLESTTLARGRVSWSDNPIEVRGIIGISSDFLATEFDGSSCQRPEHTWFVARRQGVNDWPSYCSLLGTVPVDQDGPCAEG